MINKQEINCPDDKGYKRLLKSNTYFRQLIQYFVKEGWVKEVDYENMIAIDKEYVLANHDRKVADSVYRLKVKDQDTIFIVLTELQSTVEFDMAHRLFCYIYEIIEDEVLNSEPGAITRKDYRLPAVIPIVLYNGENNWTAVRSFKEMFNNYELLGDNLINFRYTLIDVNRIDYEELKEVGNVMAATFMCDQNINQKEFINRGGDIHNILSHTDAREVDLFMNWFENISMRGFPQEHKLEILRIIKSGKLEEVEKMSPVFEKVVNESKLEGKREEKVEIARNMLVEGADIEFISKVTGLSKDQVRDLKSELAN